MAKEGKERNAAVKHQEALRPEFYQHIVDVLRAARASAYQAVIIPVLPNSEHTVRQIDLVALSGIDAGG